MSGESRQPQQDDTRADRSPTAAEGRSVGGGDLASAYQALIDSYGGASAVRAGSGDERSTPAPARGDHLDSKGQLLTAYDRLVEYEAARPKEYVPPPPPTWKRFVKPAIIAACVAGMGYTWIARPAWLYPPFEPIDQPESEAGARQLLIATSILVKGYQGRTGRMPTTVEELGIPLPGMTLFDSKDGGFGLMKGAAAKTLFLRVAPDQTTTIEVGGRTR